jgi:hypothetical protein
MSRKLPSAATSSEDPGDFIGRYPIPDSQPIQAIRRGSSSVRSAEAPGTHPQKCRSLDCAQPAAALPRQPADESTRLHSRLWQQSGSRLPQSKGASSPERDSAGFEPRPLRPSSGHAGTKKPPRRAALPLVKSGGADGIAKGHASLPQGGLKEGRDAPAHSNRVPHPQIGREACRRSVFLRFHGYRFMVGLAGRRTSCGPEPASCVKSVWIPGILSRMEKTRTTGTRLPEIRWLAWRA